MSAESPSESSAAASRIVLAVTGASGSAYALRLAQVLLAAGQQLELIFSDAARQVLLRELNLTAPRPDDSPQQWQKFFATGLTQGTAASWGFKPIAESVPQQDGRLQVHSLKDYSAGVASGSYLTRGMIICPCSMGTLSSIACGAASNLIHRAADVHLKERRPLVLVPRETPLGLIGLQNMVTLTQAGATILPAMPGFYHLPGSLADVVDFIVARICDHLHVPHTLMERWGSPTDADE